MTQASGMYAEVVVRRPRLREHRRMKKDLISWIGFGAVALLAPAGCAKGPCTLIACGSALEVNFAGSAARWPEGPYTVEVIADDEKGSCTVSLPLMCGRAPSCTGARSWMVTESGCALPVERHALSGVIFPTKTPARVNVLVFRADEVLGEENFMPSYETSRPNGIECEPTCKTAEPAMMRLQL
jgi:hypothetical protein